MEDDKVVKLKKNVKTETSKKKTNKDNREGQRERKKHAKAVYGKHVEGEITHTDKSAVITVTVKLWKSKKRNSVKEIRSERAKRKLSKKRKRNFIHHGRQARKLKLKTKFISSKEKKLHLIQTQNKIYEKKFVFILLS